MSVDECAFEAEMANCPLQLLSRGARRLGRQHGETGEPGRVGGDRVGQPVIDFPADRARQRGLIGVEKLDAGLNVGEHLHVDSRGVHRANSFGSHVAQPGPDRLVFSLQRNGKQLPHPWVQECLFQRYRAGCRLCIHSEAKFLVAVTAWVRMNGTPHQARQPRLRRSTLAMAHSCSQVAY